RRAFIVLRHGLNRRRRRHLGLRDEEEGRRKELGGWGGERRACERESADSQRAKRRGTARRGNKCVEIEHLVVPCLALLFEGFGTALCALSAFRWGQP